MNAIAIKSGRAPTQTKRVIAIASLLLGGVAASGCFYTTEERPRPGVEYEPTLPSEATGTLVVRWTIDGRTDPNECIKAVVSDLELSVTDASGREIGAWRQPCKYFSMNVTLNRGTYGGSAVLKDGAGKPRTTRVVLDSFAIRGKDSLSIPIDFPANSFL